MYLAYQLTLFYHLSQAEQCAPLGRWNDDRTVYDRNGNHPFSSDHFDVKEVIVNLQEIDRLLDEAESTAHRSESRLERRVRQRIDDLAARFNKNQVRMGRGEVRLFTEVAWRGLIDNTSMYLGWAELLLSLLFESAHDPASSRPSTVNLLEVDGVVRELVEPPTETSWEQRGDFSIESEREQFYDEVASLLDTEARLIVSQQTWPSTAGANFPPASAFVTGFDLELEMALWMLGEPFSVVAPIHVVDKHNSTAMLAWVACDMIPPRGRGSRTKDQHMRELTDLRTPQYWRVLGRNLPNDLKSRPVVVRLSGCPLLKLPAPTSESGLRVRDGLGYGPDAKLNLYHAVVIDEYTALQTALADIVGNQPLQESNLRAQSLPRELANAPLDWGLCPRYWL